MFPDDRVVAVDDGFEIEDNDEKYENNSKGIESFEKVSDQDQNKT